MRRLLILFALSAAVLAAFQWTTEKKTKPRDPNFRDVHGLVTLPDGSPAESAVVELKDMKTQKVKAFITQANGKYQFVHLSIHVDFEITVRYRGMLAPKRSLTIFDTRIDPVMNVKLETAQEGKASDKTEEKNE